MFTIGGRGALPVRCGRKVERRKKGLLSRARVSAVARPVAVYEIGKIDTDREKMAG